MKKNTLNLIGIFGTCLIILTLISCSNNKKTDKLNSGQVPNKIVVAQNTENNNPVRIKTPDNVFLTNATLIMKKNTLKLNAKHVPIRVLAYNIRRGLGMDYKTDIKRTVDVIKPLAPDLVALSEVDSNAYRSGGVKQAEYLGNVLGMENRFYKTLDKPAPKNRGKGAYGEALLSRYPIQKTIYHTLPHESNEELRVAIEIEVKIPDVSGHTQTVSFISTHLAHENETARSNQVAKLIDDLKKVKHPIILTGDLNSKPNEIPIKLLLNAGFRLSDKVESYTFNAAKPTKKIDYILTRGNIGVYGPDPKIKVIDERLASDHRPLFGKLAVGVVPANSASFIKTLKK